MNEDDLIPYGKALNALETVAKKEYDKGFAAGVRAVQEKLLPAMKPEDREKLEAEWKATDAALETTA
jgi:hypothetical protein